MKESKMTEQNQLAKFGSDVLAAITSSAEFLPRLQLLTSNSKKVKSGELPANTYCLITGQVYKQLGKSIDVHVCAWRPKAVEMGEQVLSNFDPSSAEFQRIKDAAQIKDSNCMYGPEFLMWVPSEKTFATFFTGSKSSRRDAPAIADGLPKSITLSSRHVETSKYDWWTPTSAPCSSPLEAPPVEDLATELNKFNNPKSSVVEKVEGKEGRAR
jgi:hypothetical protein